MFELNIARRYFNRHKEPILKEYLMEITPRDKSNKERYRYKVEISSPDNSEYASQKDIYIESEEKAVDIGVLESNKGNKVEVWELIRRY